MADKTFTVYSLKDIGLTFNHPDVGKMCLSENGSGQISVSRSGDLSSHTVSATGYTVVNRLVSKDGSIGLEIPTNSPADLHLDKWVSFLSSDQCKNDQFATATLTLEDRARGKRSVFTGVTPQKKPDRSYTATSPNMQYNLIYAEEIEQTM